MHHVCKRVCFVLEQLMLKGNREPKIKYIMAVLLERIANGAFLRDKLAFAYCAIAVALFVLASNDMGLAGKAVENGSRFELDQCIYHNAY